MLAISTMGNDSSKSASAKAEAQDQRLNSNFIRSLQTDWQKALITFPQPTPELQRHYDCFIKQGMDYGDTFIETLPSFATTLIADGVSFRYEIVNTYYLMLIYHTIMEQVNHELVEEVKTETPLDDAEEEAERQQDNSQMLQESSHLVELLSQVVQVLEKMNLTSLAHPDSFDQSMVDSEQLDLYKRNMEEIIAYLNKGREKMEQTSKEAQSLVQTLKGGVQMLETHAACSHARDRIPTLYKTTMNHIESVINGMKNLAALSTAEKEHMLDIIKTQLPSCLLELATEKNKLLEKTTHIDISQPSSFLEHPIMLTSRDNINSLRKDQQDLLVEISMKNDIYQLVLMADEVQQTASQLIAFAQPSS